MSLVEDQWLRPSCFSILSASLPSQAGQAAGVEVDRIFAMSPHVLPYVAWLYEKLLTIRAYVVPFAGVRGRVAPQVRLLHEGLAAIDADKLLLSFVVPQVILVRRLCSKPFFHTAGTCTFSSRFAG